LQGQERFHHGTLGNAFYRGANGAMLVYDLMNPRSIQQLAQWRDEAVSKIDADVYFPIVVIGNKLDLRVEKPSPSRLSSPSTSHTDVGNKTSSSANRGEDEEDCGDDTTWSESPAHDPRRTIVSKNLVSQNTSDDLEDAECKDSQLTVLQWCRNNSYGHLETSAKDDIGIEAAMQTIAALALEAYKTNPKNDENSKKANSNSKKINLNDLYAPKSKSACDTCAS
jgi:GTPase SAR1 family protein